MFDLTGKRAVVTGASAGIGQAVASALAGAGADVAGIHFGDPAGAAVTEEAITRAGRRALVVDGDVSDAEQVESLARTVEAAWGGIDIWVNNAGRALVRPFVQMTDAEWHDLLGTNLHGYFYGCRAAARRMLPNGSGRIINISSVTARQPISGMTAYVTSKGGVVGLTRCLALELAPHGVTVNAVAPGAVETALSNYSAEQRRGYERRIAVGRVALGADIAPAVVFLASDEAGYLTGHEILADGGLAINGNIGGE